MWHLRKFIENVRKRGISNAILKAVNYFTGKGLEYIHGPGVDITKEDWDNLTILDAYRYDYFQKYSRFEGNLQRKFSPGTNSPEFMRECFVNKQLHDTVYVTANPHARMLDEDVFYTIELLRDEWDSKKGSCYLMMLQKLPSRLRGSIRINV